MNVKSPPEEKVSARERLLAAADSLYYEEGFNTVGIERVIERAGVAKASLYKCFESKEDLVRTYLARKHDARVEQITAGLERFASPRDKLLGVFDLLGESMGEPQYRGCAIVRAGVEAGVDSPVRTMCDASRDWMRELFADLAAQAGFAGVERLAQQLMMFYDGAALAAQLDYSRNAAELARDAAEALLAHVVTLDVEPAARKRASVKKA